MRVKLCGMETPLPGILSPRRRCMASATYGGAGSMAQKVTQQFGTSRAGGRRAIQTTGVCVGDAGGMRTEPRWERDVDHGMCHGT